MDVADRLMMSRPSAGGCRRVERRCRLHWDQSGFGGREQVRPSWSTRAAGEPLDMAGVIVAGVRDGRMIWGRAVVGNIDAE